MVGQAVRIARRFPAIIKNARVEALCVLSSRVVDGGLFLLAEQILKADELQELVHRLGYLNLVNPWQPDHYYDLDLSVRGAEQLGLGYSTQRAGTHTRASLLHSCASTGRWRKS